MGELALVGDHSTVPLTRVSCNTVFSKSQNARKAGTLCRFFMVPSKSLLRVQIKRAIVTKERQNFRIKYRWHRVYPFFPVLFCFCTHLFHYRLSFFFLVGSANLCSPPPYAEAAVCCMAKRKTLCVCLSSPTALTLQNRARQSLASKKVTFKKLRAFYSLMRQLNFFLALQLGVCSWHFNLSMYYLCHKIV